MRCMRHSLHPVTECGWPEPKSWPASIEKSGQSASRTCIETLGNATSVPRLSVAVSFETDTELLIGQRLVFEADFRPVEIQKSFHQVI